MSETFWTPTPGRVFVIAEAGVNHNGDPALAHRLIDVAADAGADAVKFQTFRADDLATADAPKAAYQKKDGPAGESQREMLRRLELPPGIYPALLDHCRQRGIRFLSTPFDEASADFLDGLGMEFIKVPSGELTHHPFLTHLARLGKPLILSTGMATLSEVRESVELLRAAGADRLVVLQCTSLYPAPPETANLRAMEKMRDALGVATGLSDHCVGLEVSLAAVALGACVLEKHFTLDRSLPGPDHATSLEPGELVSLIAGVRIIERALGSGIKEPAAQELETRAVVRKSLVAAADLPAGTVLQRGSLEAKRPGGGLPPALLEKMPGRKLKAPLRRGEPLTPGHLE